MKSMIVVALALMAVVVAVPVVEPPKILEYNNEQQPDGSYAFGFKTEDDVERTETGELKEVLDEENKPQVVVVVRGNYAYTNPQGGIETIQYYADETGYHAEGPSVPKPARR